MSGTSAWDTLIGTGGADTIRGFAGEDYLDGKQGNDILDGGKDNDKLRGGSDDDTLIGGIDDDYLEGGADNDTYLYTKGDGNDNINNYDTSANNQDTLRFININADDVQASKNGDNLLLTITGGAVITVWDFFKSSDYELQRVTFADGKVWYADDLKRFARATYGTPGDDTLNGDNTENLIRGLSGNDYLYGKAR